MLRDLLVYGGPVVLGGDEHAVPAAVMVGSRIIERVCSIKGVHGIRSRSDVSTRRAAGAGTESPWTAQRRNVIGVGGLDGFGCTECLSERGEVFGR